MLGSAISKMCIVCALQEKSEFSDPRFLFLSHGRGKFIWGTWLLITKKSKLRMSQSNRCLWAGKIQTTVVVLSLQQLPCTDCFDQRSFSTLSLQSLPLQSASCCCCLTTIIKTTVMTVATRFWRFQRKRRYLILLGIVMFSKTGISRSVRAIQFNPIIPVGMVGALHWLAKVFLSHLEQKGNFV